MLRYRILLGLAGCLLLVVELSETSQAAAPPIVRTDQNGDPLPAGAIARFGTVRLRPLVGVTALAFSRDGQTVLVLEEDGTLSRWANSTGRLLGEHSASIGSPATFSADGRLLVGKAGVSPDWPQRRPTESGGWPTVVNRIRLWDTQSNKELRLFEGHTGKLHRLALSPDGKHLASAACDGTVRVWETATGKEVHRFKVPRTTSGWPAIEDLAVASGGKTVIASMTEDRDGQRVEEKGLRFYDASTGRWRVRLPEVTAERLLLSPDGSLLAVSTVAGEIRLHDMRLGKALRTLSAQRPHSMTFSADGKSLAAAGTWGAQVWNTASGKVRRNINANPQALALSSDGSSLATWKEKGRIHLWDIATGKVRRGGRKSVTAHVAAFAPDGRILVTSGDDRTIRFHDAKTWAEQRAIPSPSLQAERLTFSPDGQLLAVAAGTRLHLIESKSGKSVRDISTRGYPVRAFFSPDGRLLAVRELGGTTLWETASGKVVWKINAGAPFGGGPAFSPDGKMFIAYKPRLWLGRWDVTTGKELPDWQDNKTPPLTAVFSADGKTLTAACHRGVIATWQVNTGKPIHRVTFPWPKPSDWEGIQAALSPDGKYLAIAFSNNRSSMFLYQSWFLGRTEGRIRVFEVATGKEIRVFDGHRGWVTSLTFSPDSRLLLSTSRDGVAIVWRGIEKGR